MKIPMPDGSGTLDLLYLSADADRHGNPRLYFRRPGQRKIRLREKPGTQAFLDEYRRAYNGELAAAPAATAGAEARPGSLLWLVRLYVSTAPAMKTMKQRGRRRRLLEEICLETFVTLGDTIPHGDKPAAMMGDSHVRMICDARSESPEAANERLKALRGLFKWAKGLSHVTGIARDPAREVAYIRIVTDGFHAWTIEEVEQYERRHPVGTKARLALDLFLYTGVRRSDVVRLGPQMERRGWLHFSEVKGADNLPKPRDIPILPPLRRSIDATASGHLAYLVTEYGKPFTANGFGNWFRKRCDEAGLPQCSAHGLRKAGATIAAENGASEHQLMAVFGWESPKQAALYTRKARRKKLVGAGMPLLIAERNESPNVPPEEGVAEGETKVASK